MHLSLKTLQEAQFLFSRAHQSPVGRLSGRLPLTMAKLLPLLTAAAMIGLIGGVLLWLIAGRGESQGFDVGRSPVPSLIIQVRPGESQSSADFSNPGTESAGSSSQKRPAAETKVLSPQIGTSSAQLPSEPSASPFLAGDSHSGPVQARMVVHPGAGRGSAPVSSLLGKPPLREDSRGIENALSFALEAADPYVKEGFTLREDFWGGDLPVKQAQAIVQQLFRGNTYWFWMGTDNDAARITVHDSAGRLEEAESWQKPHKAAARIVPKKTGTYYVTVEVEKSAEKRTSWALAYGFR